MNRTRRRLTRAQHRQVETLTQWAIALCLSGLVVGLIFLAMVTVGNMTPTATPYQEVM